MEHFITTILGLITGSGITTIISLRYARKNSKLDYTDRALKFMEEREQEITERFNTLKKQVDQLIKQSCIRTNCNMRIKS